MPGSRLTPQQATVTLAAGLALSAGLAAAGAARFLEPAARTAVPPLWLLGLVGLFFAADLCLLHVEVRRQAYSVTLAGLPLVLGLLLCDPWELVAARVLGAGLAFAVQRTPGLKAGYNLSAYAAEAALDVVLVDLLLGPSRGLSTAVAGVVLLVVTVGDQLMSWLVVQVIRWHQGPLSRSQKAAVHLPALSCSLLATSAALGALLLAGDGPLGVVVLVLCVLCASAVYRVFQVLHRRHQAMQQVHDFIALQREGDSVQDVAGRMLHQVRELMRAATAELVLTGGERFQHLAVGEDGVLSVAGDLSAEHGWLVTRVGAQRGPALLRRSTRDRGYQRWLRSAGVKDAVVVPLPGSPGEGVLLVCDRLGDTGSFTGEDGTLLQTLAGHLAVAVRGSELVDRLRYDATHDSLTGLANRALLIDAIGAELAGPDAGQAAVLLLDLDRFKEVNDTLGHHTGDALLRVIADRLTAHLPADSVVSRLGGDEFAALVRHLPDPEGDATRLATTLAAALAVPVTLVEATVSTGASTGIALAAQAGSATDLLRYADTAMYASKADGAVVVYSAELDRGRAERLALLADLHLALERDELVVRYQPQLDLVRNRITSVEALVRWQHPRLGLLGPEAFVPLAEASGLIERLTAQVLGKALRQCARWRAAGHDLTVAVNLSARSVNDAELPETVSAALLAAGVPASRLVLEITESSVMGDLDGAVTILQRLAAIGVTLSLDDFGTGYSSLSYLQRLPVQEVKIDKSFVSGLLEDTASSQVLVRTIVGLAGHLGLSVVAEGVEDAATLLLLRDLGCQVAQGFHIGRPEEAAALVARLAAAPRLPEDRRLAVAR